MATTQKMKFSIKHFSVDVTKSAVSCGLGHTHWRNPWWKTSFFVQWIMMVLAKWVSLLTQYKAKFFAVLFFAMYLV